MVQEPSPTWGHVPRRNHGAPSRDALGTLLGTNPLLIPISPQSRGRGGRQAPRQQDCQTEAFFVSSACLCSPGSLQLSLKLLAKPQSQRVSAGAEGALPPRVWLHSQLVGTEEEEEGSHGKQQGLLTPACHKKTKAKSKTARAGSSKAKPGSPAQVKERQWGARDARPHHSGRDGCRKSGRLTGGLGKARPCRHHSIQHRKVPQIGFVGHVPATTCRD